MFLIHYLPMPGRHRWVMWHQTHASESHVECGSGQWHAKAVILVSLWSCLSKRLGYFLALDISLKLAAEETRQNMEKESIYEMRIPHLWWFFRKQSLMWTFLAPHLPCLSLWTQSSCLHWPKVSHWEKVEDGLHCGFITTNWGKIYLETTFTKSHLPLTW